MADNETVKAGTVPRIGEMIEKATGVKYSEYSADQKLGQTAEKPYNALEAATAAIVSHAEIKDRVYDLLKAQALIRQTAVESDIAKELSGTKLDGLPAAPVVNGKVKPGGLFMSDAPFEADIREKDKATPDKLDADLAKLAKAQDVLNDPKWLAAEGASNITNAMRDAEIEINGKTLTNDQKKAIEQGMKAEEKLLDRLEHDKPMMLFRKARTHHLEHKVEKAMDTAATAAGISLDDPTYQHYKSGMHKGIDSGMEAIKTLHDSGVTQARSDTGPATSGAAVKKDGVAKAAG